MRRLALATRTYSPSKDVVSTGGGAAVVGITLIGLEMQCRNGLVVTFLLMLADSVYVMKGCAKILSLAESKYVRPIFADG